MPKTKATFKNKPYVLQRLMQISPVPKILKMKKTIFLTKFASHPFLAIFKRQRYEARVQKLGLAIFSGILISLSFPTVLFGWSLPNLGITLPQFFRQLLKINQRQYLAIGVIARNQFFDICFKKGHGFFLLVK